jgi:hypothetical protein
MAFPMKAGDTKRLNMTITDKLGTPVDLTEAAIRWWASRGDAEKFSRTPILQKTMGNGIEDVALYEGQFTVVLAPADTRDLNGSYYHEVEITDAFGNVSTPISDTFTVTKDLIR